MKTKNTLKAIVARTPRRDREDKALRPFPLDRREVRHSRRPKTEFHLIESLEEFGMHAYRNVVYSAILKWAKQQPAYKLPDPAKIIIPCVAAAQQEALYKCGLPTMNATPRLNPLADMLPERIVEANLIISRAIRAWELAGRPCIDPEDIMRTHEYFEACLKYGKAVETRA